MEDSERDRMTTGLCTLDSLRNKRDMYSFRSNLTLKADARSKPFKLFPHTSLSQVVSVFFVLLGLTLTDGTGIEHHFG